MTDEILSLNSNNELVAKDPATGNTRPIKVADLSASGDVTVGGSSVITDALAAIDGQTITPAQTGTSTNRTDVVADTVDTNSLTGVSTGGIKTKTRVFLGATSAADPIPFDSVSYDPDSNFDTATNEYIAPADGTYQISSGSRVDSSVSAGNRVQTRILRNNAKITRIEKEATGGFFTLTATDVRELSSGDSITVENSLGRTLLGGPENTFLSITQLE